MFRHLNTTNLGFFIICFEKPPKKGFPQSAENLIKFFDDSRLNSFKTFSGHIEIRLRTPSSFIFDKIKKNQILELKFGIFAQSIPRTNQIQQQQFLSKTKVSALRASLFAPWGTYVFLEVFSNFFFEPLLTHHLQKYRTTASPFVLYFHKKRPHNAAYNKGL